MIELIGRVQDASDAPGEGQGSHPNGRRVLDPVTGLIREITVYVPGQPVGKGRPRASAIHGHVALHTPTKTRNYEALVAAVAAGVAAGARPPDAPVVVAVTAVCARPKRLCRKKDPPGRVKCRSKPDLDNVIKALIDGLVLGGVLADDKDVTTIIGSKWYAARDEGPHTRVLVRYDTEEK